jgi:hypothetical protein
MFARIQLQKTTYDLSILPCGLIITEHAVIDISQFFATFPLMHPIRFARASDAPQVYQSHDFPPSVYSGRWAGYLDVHGDMLGLWTTITHADPRSNARCLWSLMEFPVLLTKPFRSDSVATGDQLIFSRSEAPERVWMDYTSTARIHSAYFSTSDLGIVALACDKPFIEDRHIVLSVPGTSSWWISHTIGPIQRQYHFTTFDLAAGVIILFNIRVEGLGPRKIYMMN